MNDYEAMYEYAMSIQHPYFMKDGFVFRRTKLNYRDGAIFICPAPRSPDIPVSTRTLEEHIKLINDQHLEEAFISTTSIAFLSECPSLEYLHIIPPRECIEDFDYSTLYTMPQVRFLFCCTYYEDWRNRRLTNTTVDYRKISGLQAVFVERVGHIGYQSLESLKSLWLSEVKSAHRDLTDQFCSTELDSLSISQCNFTSLKGIGQSKKMQCLSLTYNRSLTDISALSEVADSLKYLRIEACGKIHDFSVLSELKNLEYLNIYGNNSIPDVQFLRKLKKLQAFLFEINVLDGDLTPCLEIPRVFTPKNRKHYNLKNEQLPKGTFTQGNEDIEIWRRIE